MADRIVLNTISYHGHGAIENIVPELTARGYKKAFVCSDPDLIKFGVTKKVTDLLDAGEQIFHFELCDLNELSRNIMADWVPLLESHDLTYEIEIPETEYMTRVDSTAYTRILNNLLQNILTHSDARQVSLTITETEQQAKIMLADNGKGISAADLPHIFERMYQCDHSRAAKGNGLGLSIAKELVSVHKGTITAASIPGAGTTFTIMLPKAL